MDAIEQTVELFCGEKAFSQIAQSLNYGTFTLDKNPAFAPDIAADILSVSASQFPSSPLIVWASPPDHAFSDRDNWEKDGTPKTPDGEKALEIFGTTINLIRELKPKWWFIENPKSILRTMPMMAGFNRGYPSRNRHTINHRQFGGATDGLSDVWTNAYWWTPHPMGDLEDFGTSEDKGGRRVPPYVFAEIFEQLDQRC